MTKTVVMAILISFVISVILTPLVIPFLRKLKFGQNVRDDGPESHLSKSGTPTMGGLIILASIAITSSFYIKDYPNIVPILFSTVGFGIVGFLDDYIKVVKKRSMGLKPIQKIIGQVLVASILCFYMLNYTDMGETMYIPFSVNGYLDLGVLFLPVFFFIVIGVVNSVNLTDGLDGLASSVTVLIATFFLVAAVILQKTDVAPIIGTAVGGLLGFLLFNVYPARVFMGDTGSLALGGFVAAVAYMLQLPLFLVIVGIIYVCESLSVLIQVGYYKKTKKRIFKMAPIHHHFELSGWPETKVVAIFSIVTAVVCLIGIIAL